MTLNGSLAGLVAVTAGCVSITPLGAVTIGVRVPEKEEVEGLDIVEHGLIAYGDFVVKSSLIK